VTREVVATQKVVDFSASVAPNPYQENFKIKLNTTSDEPIQLMVYDMLGRIVENKTSDVALISNLELGNNYPAGVYNLIISQGEEIQTLRIIKR